MARVGIRCRNEIIEPRQLIGREHDLQPFATHVGHRRIARVSQLSRSSIGEVGVGSAKYGAHIVKRENIIVISISWSLRLFIFHGVALDNVRRHPWTEQPKPSRSPKESSRRNARAMTVFEELDRWANSPGLQPPK